MRTRVLWLSSAASTRMLLVLLMVGVVGLFSEWTARPAHALNTQVFLTRAGRIAPETIVGFVGGPVELVDVRMEKLVYPTGLGSFEFTLNFNAEVVSVLGVTEGPHLGSTGRGTSCTAPVITPTSVNFSCNSLTNVPDGPVGPGVLATIELLPAASFGSKTSTSLTFSKSHLTDITGDVSITHEAVDASVLVAKCGDFNGDKVITVVDLILIILRFGANEGPPPSPDWDPAFDLNDDGRVIISDLIIEAQQFGRQCNA